MEVIYLILSGVILIAGVLYWFWSHLQLTQKKVKLLENAVFELREKKVHPPPGLAPFPIASGGAPIDSDACDGETCPAVPAYDDLADDDWADENTGTGEVTHVSTPLESLGAANPELQPGGRIEVPAEMGDEAGGAPPAEEQFRELFVGQDGGVVAAAAAAAAGPRTPESLESMPVKELRRLAEQRGISGAEGMRKKEILAALRQQITSAPATAAAAAPSTIVVERTLDIAEDVDNGESIEVPVLD